LRWRSPPETCRVVGVGSSAKNSDRRGPPFRSYLSVRLADREDVALLAGQPNELRLARADIASSAREGLLAMRVAVGMRVMGELMDAELATGSLQGQA
jgi:hypothetical protein